MSDQLLPDFDGPGNQPDVVRPGPKKPRRKPAKKKARAAPVPKPAKCVPKKRRVRKVGKHPALAAPYSAKTAISPQFTPDVYRLIAEMMERNTAERGLVIAIVNGLSGK